MTRTATSDLPRTLLVVVIFSTFNNYEGKSQLQTKFSALVVAGADHSRLV